MGSSPLSRQRGGMVSLLIALLVIGVLAYFALRAHSTTKETGMGQTQLVGCDQLANDLVGRTHGIGPDYKTGYDALPPQCRALLPPPSAPPAMPSGE